MKLKLTLFCLAFAFCSSKSITVYAQAVNKQDSLALVDLYNSTNGPGWYTKTNWLTRHSVETWYGITVTGTRVTKIVLSINSLSGGIPASIGNLVRLTGLSLYGNQLSGPVPSSLGNLANLNHLYLNDNQLSGSFPSCLSNLVRLTCLVLSHNQFTGSIPPSFGNLVNLNYLYLNDNQLSGPIPSSIGNLKNLYSLALNNNHLSGPIPSSLVNLYLDDLDLSYNNFTFNGVEQIAEVFPFDALYDQQELIPVHQNDNALFVTAGGKLSNNTYKWFKVGQTGSTTIKADSVFHPLQSGKYFATVSNSMATKLILTSDTINYAASSQFAEAASVSSQSAAQQYNKTNRFLVYPNPARDILHVETNGEATVSLTDQSGKILFTKRINGKVEINVSNLPAGFYYLKNNEMNKAQKVIIAR